VEPLSRYHSLLGKEHLQKEEIVERRGLKKWRFHREILFHLMVGPL
jgi:hypothetical protein